MIQADTQDDLIQEDSLHKEDESPSLIRKILRRRDNNGRRVGLQRKDRLKYGNHNEYQENNSQCKACGRWGCNERRCAFVAKVQIATKFIKDHGNAAAKLAEEYLRTNNRRTRMTTIRTLASLEGAEHATQFILWIKI